MKNVKKKKFFGKSDGDHLTDSNFSWWNFPFKSWPTQRADFGLALAVNWIQFQLSIDLILNFIWNVSSEEWYCGYVAPRMSQLVQFSNPDPVFSLWMMLYTRNYLILQMFTGQTFHTSGLSRTQKTDLKDDKWRQPLDASLSSVSCRFFLF